MPQVPDSTMPRRSETARSISSRGDRGEREIVRRRMRRREAVLAELEDRRSLRHRLALRNSRVERERDAVRRNLLLI